MLNTLLHTAQLVCPSPCQAYPYYCPPYMAYVMRLPTPDSLKPPLFVVRPAVVPQREWPSVSVPNGVYEGVMPLVVDNPFYRPSR